MRQLVYLFILCLGFNVLGQNKQLLYNVDNLPQTLLLNPGASHSFEKHIGIPFFSGFSLSAGSSGISVYDIFQEGGDFNARVRDAIFNLSDKDFFTVNEQIEIASFGWKPRFKDIYYSGGVYQELDAIVYFPRDLAILAYEGNASYIDVPFEFNDLSVAAEALTVYHFGVNKQVSKKLRLGARIKLYSSIVNVNSTNNRGQFITRTTPEGDNFYSHEVQNASVRANTSGLVSIIEQEASPVARAILSKNLGIGLDVGGTYTLSEKWTASGSLLDIGAVFHRDDVNNYELTGSYDLQGIEFIFPQVLDGTATTPYWENLEDEIEEQLPFNDSLQVNYTTWRPIKANAGLNYGFGKNLFGDCDCTNGGKNQYESNVGLQFFAIKRPRAINSALTAYYDRRWNRLLRTKLTYTLDAFSKRNVGLLLSANIKNFNVYLAADNLLDYPNLAKAYNASLQLGFQFTFEPD
ncbi:hypothetical protein EAX61_04330 [Dokdonia sinensis]|uniref:DUF5723 domain-containing protein n=1 Tax=Dokdonia sinensis TaxID=2479847 RepID=A0A3M0GMF9_9FLAO|nr:DUF5723 family protein [Dokdonia sinensis]RMB62813.1 hypothetical protein EAX61_04330 [Dokdonia sinensis]